MSDNKTACGQATTNTPRAETVCIDTYRVLDSCRDRDCYEDARVYLDATGQGIIDTTCTMRAIDASVVSVCIGLSEVPFNDGFFQLDLKYYILLTFEACTNSTPRTQTFRGIAVLEKKVVLWGGEENVSIFKSTENGGYCCNTTEVTTNYPIGVVETVPPIVLGTKVVDCTRECGCCHVGCETIPPEVAELLDGEIVEPEQGNHLYASLGIFSVVRIVRPGQYLVTATPYTVPDKECIPTNESDPCSLFRTMAFPVDEFTPTGIKLGGTTPTCNRCGRDR